MIIPKWKDISSRPDEDGGPSVVQLEVGPLFWLRVHRHMHFPGKWLMSVSGCDRIDKHELEAAKFEAAKDEAIREFAKRLRFACTVLHEVLSTEEQ